MDENKAIFDQLNYELFLAEQSMRMEIRQLDKKAETLAEASEIIVLNENVGDVIRKYMRQVTLSMQKAWNNFKGKINNAVITTVLAGNDKYFETNFDMACPDDFKYPELEVWKNIRDNCQIGKTELSSTNYNQMSEYLESPDKFLAQYYQDYVEKDGEKQLNMTEAFDKKCFSTVQKGYAVKQDLATNYKDFLSKYVETDIKAIQTDIEAMNQVNDNVDRMLKEVIGESTIYIGKILLEAEGDAQQNTTNNDNKNNTFRDANANPNDPNAGKNKGTKDRNNITNYYKAMTSILSAKMRTSNKVKNASLRIVTNYIKLQGGNVTPKGKKVEVTQTTTTKNNEVPQVK